MSKIEVKVTEGKRNYYFQTSESIKKCPQCKREYKARKFCLDCYKRKKEKVETFTHIKERTGTITKDLSKYMCSCLFSSWFKWGAHWKKNHSTATCKHFKQAIKKIKLENDKKNR